MRINKIGVLVIMAVMAVWFGSSAIITNADSLATQPGSVEDPVITKSYLDEQLSKLTGKDFTSSSGSSSSGVSADELKQLVAAEVEKQLKNSTPNTTPVSNSGNSSAGSTALVVVQLQPGETLFAGAGTEVIVRTGKTVTFSADENGVPDVTLGKDIAPGAAVELNHLLVFPREGRGIKPDPKQKSEINVMVRGSYMIMKP